MSPSKVAAMTLLTGLLLGPRPGLAAEPAGATPARRLAVVPFYAPEQLWRLYTPLIEFLRSETGEAWELTLHPTHEALIAEFCAGHVDVALLGPVPLGRINRRCGGVPVLVALGPGGTPSYRSVLLTADPAVTSVAALRGKEVGFFRGSTAAHVVPVRLLGDAGLSPESYRPVFLEGQDRLMTALLAGKISAAGVKSALYERFRSEPGLRVLATSEPLPNFAFAALQSSPRGRLERFAAALRRLKPAERTADAELVRSWDDEIRHGFVAPAADYLPAVRALDEATERLARDEH